MQKTRIWMTSALADFKRLQPGPALELGPGTRSFARCSLTAPP